MSAESREWGPGTNTGHGHVWSRPDGARMRCGGPGLCRACSADAATLAGRIGGGNAVPALRWEPSTSLSHCWNGYAGSRRVAEVDAHPDNEAVRWNLWVATPDALAEPGAAHGRAVSSDAAKAAAQDAWAAWCERAGLVAATEPGGATTPVTAPDAPDAVARDAAALVDAAAPVLRDLIANRLGEATGREMTEQMAAAALAPALRELARQARADGAGAGEWLHGLADALDARGAP